MDSSTAADQIAGRPFYDTSPVGVFDPELDTLPPAPVPAGLCSNGLLSSSSITLPAGRGTKTDNSGVFDFCLFTMGLAIVCMSPMVCPRSGSNETEAEWVICGEIGDIPLETSSATPERAAVWDMLDVVARLIIPSLRDRLRLGDVPFIRGLRPCATGAPGGLRFVALAVGRGAMDSFEKAKEAVVGETLPTLPSFSLATSRSSPSACDWASVNEAMSRGVSTPPSYGESTVRVMAGVETPEGVCWVGSGVRAGKNVGLRGVYGAESTEMSVSVAFPKFWMSVVVAPVVLVRDAGPPVGKAVVGRVAVISSSPAEEEMELGGEVRNPSDSGLSVRSTLALSASTSIPISSGLSGNESLLFVSSLVIDILLRGLARS